MKTIKRVFLSIIVLTFVCSLSARDKKSKKNREVAVFEISMSCENCKKLLEKNIPYEKGVTAMKVDLPTKTVEVEFKKDKTSKEKLQKAFEQLGYEAEEVNKKTMLIFASCGGNKKVEDEAKANIEEFSTIAEGIDDAHNAQNSLDVEGTYVGLIADEAGKVSTDTTIVRIDGKLFTKTVKKAGKNGKSETTEGTVGWSEDGSTITLIGAGSPNKYFVGENILFQLDKDGNKIVEGAEKYKLIKK